MKVAIILPALNPDNRLTELVKSLHEYGNLLIVVVDDGSIESRNPIFEALASTYDCVICRHPKNLGKGAALKTGFRHVLEIAPGSVCVTADADGQHAPKDIIRVAQALEMYPGSLILGTRDFSGEQVPFKSRWGNRITSLVFRLGTGVRCPDTQTGLRGIPAERLQEMLDIPGERFEYEMNVLMEAARKEIPLASVPIDTIYLEKNRSSHFNPVLDSIRIYANILKFGISSVVSTVVDLTLFALLMRFAFGTAASGIFAATGIARLFSGMVNFLLNKTWVFGSRRNGLQETAKYLALFCGQLLASGLLVEILSNLPIPLMLVKMLVDGGLFFLSYHIQSKYIFRRVTAEKPKKECMTKQ